MMNELQALLGVKQDVQRVMTVTQRLGNNRIRVEASGDYLIVAGDYDVVTRLIISGSNVVGVVGKSAGTFSID
jgi:hypothetical protein